MPIRVLIAPDKFKGTLSAGAAARAIARGWRRARPADALDLFPISDGGDGFGEVLGELLGARAQSVSTLNAAHEPCTTQWWWEATTQTAIIESARIIGLAMLPPGKYHPFKLDTFGLGAVLRAAAQRGARRCVIGIGGSATNDGGFGMAKALGWQFLNRTGQALESWTQLGKLARLVVPGRTRLFRSLVVAVDVRNPLLGPDGATRVYGPQKGIQRWDVAPAERCLRQLAHVSRVSTGRDFTDRPGAGAAGGLGFGLALFLGARFTPGFDLIARHGGLAERMARAKVVVTGEGAMDCSTLMGKGAGQIAERCRRRRIPCIGLAGVVTRSAQLTRQFDQLRALTDLTSPDEAKANAAAWLERLAERAAGILPAEPFVRPAQRAIFQRDAASTMQKQGVGQAEA
jgi:glycerate kinase